MSVTLAVRNTNTVTRAGITFRFVRGNAHVNSMSAVQYDNRGAEDRGLLVVR
jgi:hypothetical protein